MLEYLMLKSGYMPKVIGGLLALAGFAYTVPNSLLSNHGEYKRVSPIIVAVPTVIAELVFTTRLLLKAGKQ